MRAGEFPDGAHVLRAKIDMASPNINMRDPTLYRIRHATHHRTGDAWCIYPIYDYAHPISDAIEGITHSLCTLEFEDHRPLYDWVVEHMRAGAAFTAAAAADRVRAAEPELHGDEQAQAARARRAEAWSPAGTIRACRRSPASGAAATRRRRSATSARASAWPRRRTSIDVALLEHTVREDLNRARAAGAGGAAAAEGRDRELAGRVRRARRRR